MASPLEQTMAWFPVIGSVIGFLLYTLMLKITSILLKFKNKTWKIAALVSISFIVMGYLFGRLLSLMNLLRWSQLVSLIILIPLVKYLYRESWGKSIVTVVILFFGVILASFLIMAVTALIMLLAIKFGLGIPVTTLS